MARPDRLKRWCFDAVLFEPGTVAEVRYLAGSQLRHATLLSLAFDQPVGAPGL
jgi:hypothetical protein